MTNQSRINQDTEPSRLRLWRLNQGFVLAEVADLTGLSVSILSRVERGERSLRPETKVRMARRLGVPISALFAVEDIVEDAV